MDGGGVDLNELEEVLVAAAADYGSRRGITYAAWREAGVSPSVLSGSKRSVDVAPGDSAQSLYRAPRSAVTERAARLDSVAPPVQSAAPGGFERVDQVGVSLGHQPMCNRIQ